PQAPPVPPQQGYAHPQQAGYPGGPRVASMARRFSARLIDGVAFAVIYGVLAAIGVAGSVGEMQECDPASVTYESCVNDAGS
ncbi:RDD family protein, partial [Streptomyces sp. TRM76130]|nr:RDD family protein [Streptomyces sp. TRM76130]